MEVGAWIKVRLESGVIVVGQVRVLNDAHMVIYRPTVAGSHIIPWKIVRSVEVIGEDVA